MSIRAEVEKILAKDYADFMLSDVVELSKLKMKVGRKVAEAKNKVLIGEQLFKNERAKTTMLVYAEGGAYDKAKDEAVVRTNEQRLKLIQTQSDYEELNNYYNDLNDCLIAVRQTVKAFDYENNRDAVRD